MPMVGRSNRLKFIGAAGTAALTVGAMAAPAFGAGELSAFDDYFCHEETLGTHTISAAYYVDAPPATMTAGQTVKLNTTATFTLTAATTDSFISPDWGWVSFAGTVDTTPNNVKVGQDIDIDKTLLGTGPGGTTVADASGKTLLRYTKAGAFDLQNGDITQVVLWGYTGPPLDKRTGGLHFPDDINGYTPCEIDRNAGLLRYATSSDETATVTVVKDASETATSAKYLPERQVAKGTAKVKGASFGLAGTGTVKFTLKRGLHTIKTRSDQLNKKGMASVAFKHVKRHGRYSITAKFGGDEGLKGSKDRDRFSV